MNFKILLYATICLFCFLGCQFNMKVADKNNNLKVEKLVLKNFYMHNYSGTNPKSIDVYLDHKKVNLETLDTSGIELEPGRHSLDVVPIDKKISPDHFEFDVKKTEPIHMYLCKDPKNSKHFSLTDKALQYCEAQE